MLIGHQGAATGEAIVHCRRSEGWKWPANSLMPSTFTQLARNHNNHAKSYADDERPAAYDELDIGPLDAHFDMV